MSTRGCYYNLVTRRVTAYFTSDPVPAPPEGEGVALLRAEDYVTISDAELGAVHVVTAVDGEGWATVATA